MPSKESQYLSDLILQTNHLYNNCAAEDVTAFYSRTDAIKYTSFQYIILELDWNTQRSKTMPSFTNSLLRNGWHIPKPNYNTHNPTGLTLLNRLKVGLSHLNQHKFNHSFRDCLDPLCSCSLEIESPLEFFRYCHYFTDVRKTFFNEKLSVDENTLNQSDNAIVEILL